MQYRDIDIAPLLAAVNIILAQHPSKEGVVVGRNRFFFPQDIQSMGGGLEAWKGFYSSARPSYKQLMVNVNVATTAFYSEGNLANAMIEYRNHTFGARAEVFVKGLRVQTTHIGFKKTIKKLSNRNAKNYKFAWDEEKREVTIEEYFRRSTSYCSCLVTLH